MSVVIAPIPNGYFVTPVRISDGLTGANVLKVNPDGSLNTTSNVGALSTFKASQYAVGTTAAIVASPALSNRSAISLKAICSTGAIIYVGNSASVSTTTGYPLSNNDSVQMDLGPAQSIYAISNLAAQTLAVMEIA